MRSLAIIRNYYFATPLFVILDVLMGLDWRAAFLAETSLRWWWYGLCMVLALILWRWPRLSPLVGVAESSVNFLLLIGAVLVPIMLPDIDRLTASDAAVIGLSGWSLLAFLLIGSACIVSFHAAVAQLAPVRR